jgi:DNA-binding NtrC family response regulator
MTARAPDAPATGSAGPPSPIAVLLVDDEADFCATLAKILRRRGMQVGVAPSGEAAIEAVRARPFDAIVLDLKMPGLDGLATLRSIHALRPGCQVIILTGHGTADAGLRAIREHAFDFLLKPVVVDHLVSVIEDAARAAPPKRPDS